MKTIQKDKYIKNNFNKLLKSSLVERLKKEREDYIYDCLNKFVMSSKRKINNEKIDYDINKILKNNNVDFSLFDEYKMMKINYKNKNFLIGKDINLIKKFAIDKLYSNFLVDGINNYEVDFLDCFDLVGTKEFIHNYFDALQLNEKEKEKKISEAIKNPVDSILKLKKELKLTNDFLVRNFVIDLYEATTKIVESRLKNSFCFGSILFGSKEKEKKYLGLRIYQINN